ncbi:protein maestro-like [Phalacrocorax aristotelis]|uniref:protein maestro-like n=1 Tax=Phalacrocorax aristotelis TaxID=126867 RepID=UPI003F4BD2F1
MTARGLGNAVRRAPEEVRRHKEAILEALQRGLRDTTCPEVAAESMLALAEVVRKLKAEGLGSAFKDVARSTKMFFEAEPEVLRSSAFSLYAALASSASGKRSFFAREVAETWVSLLLHLRDPDPEVSNARAPTSHLQSRSKPGGTTWLDSLFQVCRTALYLCAPFLGPERVQETIITSIGLSAAELQYEVCHCLVRDAPAVLERLRSIARSRHLENGQALHSATIAVLGDILEKARGLSGSCQQQE